MKKVYLFSLLLIASSVLFAQEVKQFVGIVKPIYSEEYKTFLTEYKTQLERTGLQNYTEYIDSFLEGSFGSGFVYVDSSGENYVITNKHVSSDGEVFSFEIQSNNNSKTLYDNLYLYASDEDKDISILKFQGNKRPFKQGLPFYNKEVFDGREVFTAGYPALGENPIWQFGTGNVTNSYVDGKDFLDTENTFVYQHSAQVDSGNSGGPLLIKENNQFYVIGINTWKAINRESTNYSVPIKYAVELINSKKQNSKTKNSKEQQIEKIKKIIKSDSKEFVALAKFVSLNLAKDKGPDLFKEILWHESIDVRNVIAYEFRKNPIAALKMSVAFNIYSTLKKSEDVNSLIQKLSWTIENDSYKIESYTDDFVVEEKKESESKVKREKKVLSIPSVEFYGIGDGYLMEISPGMNIPFTKDTEVNPNFKGALSLYPFGKRQFGFGIDFNTKKLLESQTSFWGIHASYQLPFDFGLFSIIPNAKAGWGMGFSEESSAEFFYELGIKTLFDFGFEFFRPGINISYYGRTISIDNIDFKDKGLSIGLVLGFFPE